MNKLLQILGSPFMWAANYVDQRPSGEMIREHAARLKADVRIVSTTQPNVVTSTLVIPDIDSHKYDPEGILTFEGEGEDIVAYRRGVEHGVQLMQHTVATVTRREIKTDNRELRNLRKAEQAEAKAGEAKLVDDAGATGNPLPV